MPELRVDHLLIVQATPFCNIDCRYCYLPNRLDRRRMSTETFEQVIANVVESQVFESTFTVCWHAGEPLVMPIAFYEECLRITRRYESPDLRIDHNVQTNLTLLTEAWCDFFRRSEPFSVGVSVDGPAFLHDASRIDRNGRGTFERVERGLRLLRTWGVPFTIICVLTREHLRHPKELHDFLSASGASAVSFNIEEIEGVHRNSTMLDDAVVDDFKDFMRQFLGFNDASERPLRLRRCEYNLLAKSDKPPTNDLVIPWSILIVDYLGNVSTFSPELIGTPEPRFDDFKFGNLSEQSLSTIRQSPKFRALEAEVASGVARCKQECEYFEWCGGGSPSNKYFEHGRFDVTETLNCRLMKKAVLDVNLERLEEKLHLIASAVGDPVHTRS